MTGFRRLISYIYEYEGNVKGKNVGFVKLEARNGMCRLSVSVKKLYMGSSDMGVYLLTGRQEIFLGDLFLRNGCGEFRTVVQLTDVQESGESMDECYGLTLHGKNETWRVYTTIWEDAVAQAAQLTLENVTSENAVEHEVESGRLSSVVPEASRGKRDAAEEKGRTESPAEGKAAAKDGAAEPGAMRKESAQRGTAEKKAEADVPEPDTSGKASGGEDVAGAERLSEAESAPGAVGSSGAESILGAERASGSERAPGAESASGAEGVADAERVSGTRQASGAARSSGTERTPCAERVPRAERVTGTRRAPGAEPSLPEFLRAVRPERPASGQNAKIVGLHEKSAYASGRSDQPKEGAATPGPPLPDHEMGRLEMETVYPDIPLARAAASGLFSAPAQAEPGASAHEGPSGQQPGTGQSGGVAAPHGQRDRQSAGMAGGLEQPGRRLMQAVQSDSRPVQGDSRPFQAETPMVIHQHQEEPLIIGDPQALAKLDEQEAMEKLVPVWDFFADTYPKIQAFDSEHGCQVLVIKPQDIGLLPREIWIYGNNSFLLHGYYNYRYLILARLENPKGLPRYLLGVPGHYYSNEKYMASMFGFPHFVLSKRQPAQDGRFGYWYTDIRMEENAVLGAAAVEKARKRAY